MVPRPIQNIYDGYNGDKILKEKLLMYLSQEAEDFVLESINRVGTMKYWNHHYGII